MAFEIARIQEWLQTTLEADSALAAIVGTRIYMNQAQQGAAYPYVTHQQVSSPDDSYGTGPDARFFVWPYFDVKTVGLAADYANLKSAADRIDAVLESASGTADTTGHIYRARRRSAMSYPENDAGVAYEHLVQTYRIWCEVE